MKINGKRWTWAGFFRCHSINMAGTALVVGIFCFMYAYGAELTVAGRQSASPEFSSALAELLSFLGWFFMIVTLASTGVWFVAQAKDNKNSQNRKKKKGEKKEKRSW